MPSAATSSPPSSAEAETWGVKISKRMVSPDRLHEVRARLAIMQSPAATPDLPRACLVPFSDITISPMFLTVHADAARCAATLGERASYTVLPRGVGERVAVHLLRHVCLAVADLHGYGITHSHLSSGNVVWSESRRQLVLLGHLLPISLFTPTSPLGVVSRLVAAPEILRNEPYGTAADVWSIGVLLLQMMLPASKSFETADVEDTDLLSPLLTTVSTSGRSLLLQCLKSDPSRRPTAADLLLHPLLAEAHMAHAEEGDDGTSEADCSSESTSDDEETAEEAHEPSSEERTDSSDEDAV